MEYVAFYVGERAVVYWDPDLRDKNLEFLQGVDARYYEHIADTHAPALEGESKLQAAAALRIAYAQGLEALFGLLCALAQAPTCMVGWMQSYRTAELCQMVEAVSSKAHVRVLPDFRPCSWEHMAHVVFAPLDCDDERKAQVAQDFGRLWTRFARDFLDEEGRHEYNALKHGSRPRMGGFTLAIGRQPDKGVPPAPEHIHSIGGSEYGSTFFVPERLSGRLHWRPRRTSVNWVPQNLVCGLAAIAASIRNVVAYARHGNGDVDDCLQYAIPTESTYFDRPWASHPGVVSSSFDTRFGVESIDPWRQHEVEAMLAVDQETSG